MSIYHGPNPNANAYRGADYGGYSQNNYNNGSYNKGFKKSGFTVKMMDSEGWSTKVPVCSGWRKTKFGLQKIYARVYKKSKRSKSDNGIEWINLFVTISVDGQAPYNTSGMFRMDKKQLYIKELNLIGSTNGSGKTRSGKTSRGYFGRHIK